MEEEVVRLGKKLEKVASGAKSEDGALDIVKRLAEMDISVELLQKTRVGMRLNEIRKKTTNEELATAAKALIKRWKKLLDGGAPAPVAKAASQDSQSSASPKHSGTPAGTGGAGPDGMRGKCVDMLMGSLVGKDPEDLPNGTLDPERLAVEIEEALYAEHKGTGSKYSAALRSRVFNLRDKKNPALRLNILTGVIAPGRFAVMSSEEMASEDVKHMREKFTKEAIEEHQMSVEAGTPTDMFKCGKCKKYNCTYTQLQTRSADEPMTTFVFCKECGNRWKFC